MLFGIPPLLGPDLLHTLRSMGHGDEIALVDGNYPAAEHGRRLVRADGLGLLAVLEAILQLLPVEAAFRSSQDNDPAKRAEIHHKIDGLGSNAAQQVVFTALSGAELYPRIRAAYAIVATSEPQLYANVILRKGALPPASPK